jgi:hypothetical protein
MRAWVWVFAFMGCSDPPLGKASMKLVSPQHSFDEPLGRSYSRSSSDGAMIGFFRNDFERADGSGIFCSDVLGGISGISLIKIDLTGRALATTGTVPVGASLDPAIASASITSSFARFEMGSLELTDVDDAIVGSFAVTGMTETGETATFTGSFDATRCD